MQSYLIFDADDTLWENNIYFEQAIHNFVSFLKHSTLTHAEVRGVLDKVERARKGYGTESFVQSLLETYQQLAEREVTRADEQQIQAFGASIMHHPIDLLAGVKETLDYLSPRHHLFLLTKGNEEEQRLKIERSELASYFRQAIIVAEKDEQAYRQFVQDFALDTRNVWMIGNSPKSDINPALKAGMNAVYIPHPNTWHLEHQEIAVNGEGKLLTLHRFIELREHF